MVYEIEIIPPTPKPGDQINIKIKGARIEKVPIELNYIETIPVVGNTFVVTINKVQVPWPNNRLFIEAKNVATMNLGVKFLLWINKKVEIVDSVGQYTLKNVPTGTYSVKMNGTTLPGIQEVTIKITAFSELQLDQSGNCMYTFYPNPKLGGNLAVKCNEIEKTVEIKPRD